MSTASKRALELDGQNVCNCNHAPHMPGRCSVETSPAFEDGNSWEDASYCTCGIIPSGVAHEIRVLAPVLAKEVEALEKALTRIADWMHDCNINGPRVGREMLPEMLEVARAALKGTP